MPPCGKTTTKILMSNNTPYIIMCKKMMTSGRETILILLAVMLSTLFTITTRAQEKVVNPEISYVGTPRQCEIGGIHVQGIKGYDDFVLVGLSGLEVGQRISVPGTEIS